MKLPFTFGNRLVFRLVLPGLMLALVTIPGFHAALAAMTGEQISPTAYLPLLTVFLGWLMTLADMPVYMLFEGRRFWPEPIFSWALNRERRRLRRLLEESKSASESGNERASLEKQVDASRFPLDASGERFAAMPTRLGNLVYEY